MAEILNEDAVAECVENFERGLTGQTTKGNSRC
jgi:hypothetical protein